jgi:glycosyltransferase involved in cell wall biosynthesis
MCSSKKPIKIVRLITRLNIGGPAIQAITLAADLPAEKFTTLLVCGRPGPREGDMTYLAVEKGIEPIVFASLQREVCPLRDILSLFRIVRLLRREKADILHTHMSKAGTLGRIAAMLCPTVKTVHTFHGNVLTGYFSGFRSRIYIFIERWLARHTDRLIALGDSQKCELFGRFGIGHRDQFTVIPLGFDLERFARCEAVRGELRKELGIPGGVPIIATVGRLVSVKDHDLFLSEASLIHAEQRDSVFLIVGDGPMRAELEEKILRMGLERSVIFLGWRRDIEKIYADADVVVLTSKNEGTPVSLIEAAASGKPVVATNVGGVEDVVRNGVSGLLTERQKPGEIARAVINLIRDPEKRARMGEEGRNHVLRYFAKKRLLDDIARMYDTICQS